MPSQSRAATEDTSMPWDADHERDDLTISHSFHMGGTHMVIPREDSDASSQVGPF